MLVITSSSEGSDRDDDSALQYLSWHWLPSFARHVLRYCISEMLLRVASLRYARILL